MDFVQVAEDEGEEPIELPTEEDGTLLQTTLQAQYPGSCGLKYRNEETKAVRGVRLNDGRFCPPSSEDGWGTQIFFCVFPKENKRKSDDNLENSTAKTKRVESRARCTDLIVLGLPWKTTEESLREHFEEFGDVLMAQVKKDMESGQSKGFGFVRFAYYEAQKRVLSTRHLIDGRWCEVKVPNSKQGMMHQVPCKVFVGRCTEEMTAEDLREYFSKFGEVTDVFIPKPFRAFSFVTFLDPDVAQSLCGEDHIVKGISVHVSNAAPKTENLRNNGNNNNGGNYNNYNNRYGGNGNQGGNNMNGMPQHGRGNHNNGYGNNMNGGGSNNAGMMGNNMGGNGMGMGAIGNGGSAASNRQDNGMLGYNNPQNRGGGNFNMQGQGMQPQTNGGWNNQNRGNLDMPNLQALGINPQGQNTSNQGQNLNNPLGVGLNLNQLPMNPAIVAAALNQWGLMGNIQNQSQDQAFGGGGGQNNQSGSGNPGGSFLSWMTQNAGGNNSGAQGLTTAAVSNDTQQINNHRSWPRKNNPSIGDGSDQKPNNLI